MALTATEISATNDRIAQDLYDNSERIKGTLANAQASKNSLVLLGTIYGPYVTELNALAAANPTDDYLVSKASEANKFASDFASYSVLADSLILAIDAVLNPVA